jgi:hypothetical protein
MQNTKSFVENHATVLIVVAIAAAMLSAAISVTVHAGPGGANLKNCATRPYVGAGDQRAGSEVEITTRGTPAHDITTNCPSVRHGVENPHTLAACVSYSNQILFFAVSYKAMFLVIATIESVVQVLALDVVFWLSFCS